MENISAVKRLSDEELAQKVVGGCRFSFEELVSRYSTRLFYFLRHRTDTDQDIEDLLQETFLKAFRNINRFNSELKFSTWLYTIASRQAISRHRSKKPHVRLSPAAPASSDPQEDIIKKEESENIWSLASSLPQKQYEALWMHYAEEMSIKDMANVMRKKPITVRVLLHRARVNLAKKMSPSALSGKFAGATPAEHKFSF
jgi:RNA polymerase sigma-70 factor (ECF subfamily)